MQFASLLENRVERFCDVRLKHKMIIHIQLYLFRNVWSLGCRLYLKNFDTRDVKGPSRKSGFFKDSPKNIS
jgi:hypothetical protein